MKYTDSMRLASYLSLRGSEGGSSSTLFTSPSISGKSGDMTLPTSATSNAAIFVSRTKNMLAFAGMETWIRGSKIIICSAFIMSKIFFRPTPRANYEIMMIVVTVCALSP